MVIDRMDGFASLGRQLLDRFQGASRTDVGADGETDNTQRSGAETRMKMGDKAEISSNAHRLMALREAMDLGIRALEDEPDVRPDRIAEARSRLHRGYYNSTEVRTKVAERFERVASDLEDIQEK